MSYCCLASDKNCNCDYVSLIETIVLEILVIFGFICIMFYYTKQPVQTVENESLTESFLEMTDNKQSSVKPIV